MEMVQTIVFASSSEHKWSVKAYDADNASLLFNYCGASTARGARILSVANGCILEAQKGRAKINVWPMNKHNCDAKAHIFAPGKIDSFATTSRQNVLAYAIKDILYFYESSSGQMYKTNTCHYLSINIIKFSSDDYFVATGGVDGIISIWLLGEILNPAGKKEPLYKFGHHSLPVTDIAFSKLARRVRLVSASEDRTVKVYDVITGSMLSIIFETGLNSVALPSTDLSMYLGLADGSIKEVKYTRIPETRECHIADIIRPTDNFIGHTDAVTSLAMADDGTYLVSGSNDGTVRIWDSDTHFCLHVINDKNHISCILVAKLPKQIFQFYYKPKYHFQPVAYKEEPLIEMIIDSERVKEEKINQSYDEENVDVSKDTLKKINKELYDFACYSLSNQLFTKKKNQK